MRKAVFSRYDVPPGQICSTRSWWSTWCRAEFPGPGVALLCLGRWCWKVEALDCCGGGSSADVDALWPRTPAAPAPSNDSATRSARDCVQHLLKPSRGKTEALSVTKKQINMVLFADWWRCKRPHIEARKRGRCEGFWSKMHFVYVKVCYYTLRQGRILPSHLRSAPHQ